MENNVKFLKQIPYIQGWEDRQVVGLHYLLKERKILRGQTIVKEGNPCNSVFFIGKGDCEVVKTNLRKVFYNNATGVVGIK